MENIKEQKLLKVPAKASAWYIASGGISRAIGALSTPIFTRLLTPEEYGLYPLYNTWIGVLSVLITLELTGSAIYRGFQKYSDKKNDFTSATLGLLSAVFITFCALYFAFFIFLKDLTGLNLRISILMLAQIYATSVISLYLAKARFEYKYRAVALLNLISSVTIPFSAIVLILLTNLRAEARIYASSLVMLLVATPIAMIIIRGSERFYSKEIWKYLLTRSIPMLPHYFATALILKITEISISRNYGTEALGKYSIAISVGMVLTIVTTGILSALSPWIIRKIRDGEIAKIQDFLLALTRALALMSLLVLAIAPELLAFLAADRFRSALPAIYPLEIAVIFSFLSGAIMSGCSYYERGSIAALPSILAAGASIILSLLLLPKVDYRFAGVITLFSYVIMALIASIVFKHLSGKLPIDLKRISMIFLLTIAYATILFMFRGVLVSRIFLSLPILALLLICAKDIWIKVKE